MQSLSTLVAALVVFLSCSASAQQLALDLHGSRPIVDAHNCYPYDGRWSDRIERALKVGFPIGIEQDLAWYIDPATGKGRIVVAHSEKTTGSEPTLRGHFFERIRPIIETALAKNNRSQWPLIIVHFDVKDNREPLLRALWTLLGDYESWITTAVKTADPHQISPLDIKPLLVLTEEPEIQERIFFRELPVGGKLRLFGSALTAKITAQTPEERNHISATLPPERLVSEPATNYRRWWNNSWYEVEEGGQPHAGAWTPADNARLRSLSSHAHALGYWIRFYTLDGFSPELGDNNGWFQQYNLGSLDAVRQRWKAAIDNGVDMLATDQYEELASFLHSPGIQSHSSK